MRIMKTPVLSFTLPEERKMTRRFTEPSKPLKTASLTRCYHSLCSLQCSAVSPTFNTCDNELETEPAVHKRCGSESKPEAAVSVPRLAAGEDLCSQFLNCYWEHLQEI